jgi:steroid 5-alpha reductase family enzyme
MNWAIYLDGLLVISLLAIATWLLSIYLRDVSIVDSAWSLMFLAAAIVYLVQSDNSGLKNILVTSLVAIWATRLSAHLTWRNWGEPEDRRYQAIREKYSPNFEIKSLFIVFLFQAVLAWIVTLPILGALTLEDRGTALTTGLFMAGIVLWVAGMFFETVADWQLARFKNNPANHGKVMDKGLWKYSRHPNYFGECIIWWGFFLVAFSYGAWWSVISPLIMTWLLLKFSGVVMLEETISERRPDYRKYIKRTNAFFPGTVKESQ